MSVTTCLPRTYLRRGGRPNRLAEFDPRESRIAELRFFGGLSLQDSQTARAWLYTALMGASPR